MLKNLLHIGTVLSKSEQQSITGGIDKRKLKLCTQDINEHGETIEICK